MLESSKCELFLALNSIMVYLYQDSSSSDADTALVLTPALISFSLSQLTCPIATTFIHNCSLSPVSPSTSVIFLLWRFGLFSGHVLPSGGVSTQLALFGLQTSDSSQPFQLLQHHHFLQEWRNSHVTSVMVTSHARQSKHVVKIEKTVTPSGWPV